MNNFQIIGRTTKDLEVKMTANGKKFIYLSVAQNIKNPDGSKGAMFLPIIAWEKVAENTAKFCGKGSQIAIQGRINSIAKKDANGQPRNELMLVATQIEFLETKAPGNAAPQAPIDDSVLWN